MQSLIKKQREKKKEAGSKKAKEANKKSTKNVIAVSIEHNYFKNHFKNATFAALKLNFHSI